MKLAPLQKLTRDIQDVVADSQVPDEFLISLAAEDSEACVYANERLSQTISLLHGGYRDEAVQIADQSPNLLEVVALLDFPSRAEWLKLLQKKSLESPPWLMMSAADELEQTYDRLRALDHLLKKNRLLALSQAPLPARIFVLQRLAQQDPANPIWIDDSEMLQRARLSQIKEEYARAESKNDTTTLLELTKELQGTWDIPIPSSLRDRVVYSSTELAKSEARIRMEQIAIGLNDALIEFDDGVGRQHRENWNQENHVANLAAGDEVFQSAQEALTWLSDLDEQKADDNAFQIAVADLEASVERHVTIDVLDRKIYDAQKFERDLPDSLIHRVNQYREGLEINSRRRLWLKITSAVTVLLVCIAAVAWYLDGVAYNNSLNLAREQMVSFVKDQGFKSGQKYFDSLPEFVRKDGEVIRLHGELVANGEKEASRKQEFDRYVKQVDLTGDMGFAIEDIVKAIDQLSITNTEKRQTEILKNQINSERMLRQNARNQRFLKELGKYRDSLERIINQDVNHESVRDLSSLIIGIEKLTDSSTAFVDGKSGISTTIKRNANNLVLQASARIKEIETANQAIAELNEMARRVNDPVRFASGLKDFANRFADDKNSVEFSRTANEVEIWTGLQNWQKLAATHNSISLESISPKEAAKKRQRLQQLSQKLSIEGTSNSVNLLAKYLNDRATVPKDGARTIRQLKSVFTQPSFSAIQVVRTKNGEVRYLSAPFDPQGDTKYRYFDKNASTRTDSREAEDQFAEAPHCEIAKKLATTLETGQVNDFQELIVNLVATTLEDQPGAGIPLDPILQCEFLDQILLFAKLTSPALKPFSEKYRNEMKTQKLLVVDWKAPYPADAPSRASASNFLKNFERKFADLRSKQKKKSTDMAEVSSWHAVKDYSIVGFLYRTNSSWKVATSQKIDSTAKLYCLIPTAKDTAKFELLGDYTAKSFANVSIGSLQAGRPVFILSPKK